MNRRIKKKLIRTAGYTLIGVGVYLVAKGSERDKTIRDIIDAEFVILEDD